MRSGFHPRSVRTSVGVSPVREIMERHRLPLEVYPSRCATCATVTDRSESWYATDGGFYFNNNMMILPPMALVIVGIIIWIQRARNTKLIEQA